MTFPGYENARFDSLSSAAEGAASGDACRCSRLISLSLGPNIVAGLVTDVVLAVMVCAVLLRLVKLVTLAGLVSDFSSKFFGLGIDIALATADNAPLIDVVATGASCGRLMLESPPPAINEERTLWDGFSLISLLETGFCCSSFLLRSSASAAAPVRGAGEKRGEKDTPNLDTFDMGGGLEFVITAKFEGSWDDSGRLLFRDFAGGSICDEAVLAAVDNDVASTWPPTKVVVEAEIGPCSEAMCNGDIYHEGT